MSRLLLEKDTPFAPALDLNSIRLADEQFEQLCRDNEDLRLELTADGDLIITAPTGGTTGSRNADITAQITVWAKKDGTGLSFDSSTMFCLPNGAKRSPDAAWVSFDRWNALTEKEGESLVPLCPDFVLELRSAADSLSFLQDEMKEYISNGSQLGMLIDPKSKQVYLYRANQPVELLDNPLTVSGDPVLPGFVLDMKDIW